ncbi:MAG TPA: ABC transporter substrate-binding protein [Ktedonobacteraceae bacterium]|nr:ABC transporter substrate-binding protein [Ktedonobacteraceae bacterium]
MGLSYTFTLKPNLTFSDGTPLTATDLAYSINRVLLPATQSPSPADARHAGFYQRRLAGRDCGR